MQEFFTGVGQVGFPIIVAGYFMLRFENKIETFGNKIDKLSEVFEGKPSEGRKGLIQSINENTQATNSLVKEVKK